MKIEVAALLAQFWERAMLGERERVQLVEV